jgi:5-(carboxyamino)imidazole ribonucleotide mutase
MELRDHTHPLVGILMGSSNDTDIMNRAYKVLSELKIPCEISVLSAHRTPDETIEYARTAEERNIKVLIAGAGMAAHLAGIVAANTMLPVIGVPISSGPLNGQDALYATVQMPSGTPVATVAINGAENAAYMAARILALDNTTLAINLEVKRNQKKQAILTKSPKGKNYGM